MEDANQIYRPISREVDIFEMNNHFENVVAESMKTDKATGQEIGILGMLEPPPDVENDELGKALKENFDDNAKVKFRLCTWNVQEKPSYKILLNYLRRMCRFVSPLPIKHEIFAGENIDLAGMVEFTSVKSKAIDTDAIEQKYPDFKIFWPIHRHKKQNEIPTAPVRIAMLVNKTLVQEGSAKLVRERRDLCSGQIPTVWCEIGAVDRKTVLVCVFYRLWNEDVANAIDNLSLELGSAHSEEKPIILMGDMNLDYSKNTLPQRKAELRRYLLEFGLERMESPEVTYTREVNGTKSLIDHIYVSKSLKNNGSLSNFRVGYAGRISDHFPLHIDVTMDGPPKVPVDKRTYTLKNGANFYTRDPTKVKAEKAINNMFVRAHVQGISYWNSKSLMEKRCLCPEWESAETLQLEDDIVKSGLYVLKCQSYGFSRKSNDNKTKEAVTDAHQKKRDDSPQPGPSSRQE